MRFFRRQPNPFLVILLAGLAAAVAGRAEAQLKIDITQGRIEPLPIAIADFLPANEGASQLAAQISSVIRQDLERSGLFRPIDTAAFVAVPKGTRVRPNFDNWRVINAQALVVGAAEIDARAQLVVEFRLWDVFTEQAMTGLRLTTESSNWRRVAHKVADAIYERMTGERGYFDTRLVFISESGPADKRIKRLSIMDQDGANQHFLTSGDNLVLTPRFSPNSQEITYLSYIDGLPRVYLYNIDTGEQEALGDFPGMSFAPRFSPSGDEVVMSLAERGNTDIFVMDLRTRMTRQLTTNPAIDTAPSYSPDGTRIVFESSRGGSQQLYVMNADGGDQHRISFGRGRYGTPVWSPRGDLVAFTKIVDGAFHIGVMRPDGTGERLLTSGFLVEGPTWAPNGRVLMFFRQEPTLADGSGGASQLYSIDLTGFNERIVKTPGAASDPAWGPATQ